MKRIRQTRLHFQEGSSDKVYEAELLQLSESEYLVNFRYGKRGGSLKEGTKTEKAVAFEAAAKIYKSLVVSKMNKGYELESGFDPLEQVLTAPVAKASTANDKRPNSEHILERLRLFSQPSPPISRVSAKKKVGYIQGHSLSRTLWQAIQYNLPECIEYVPGLIGSENIPLNYSLVWALGKFGNASHLSELERLKKDLPPSMFYLVDEVREQWLRSESDVSDQEAETEALLSDLNHCQTLLEKLSAYSRYEKLRTHSLNQNELEKLQNVLKWRGIAETLLPDLQAAPIEQEWLDFLQALPETLRETLESDSARFADLRQALNDLVWDWLHTLKVQNLPYYAEDKALYARMIDQVPLAEITAYEYYQNYLRRGQLDWLNDDIKRKLGNYINRQRLIPTDYPLIDAHDLINRLISYVHYDRIETKPLTEAQRQAAWKILERYQCHQSVRSVMDQKPMKIDPIFIQTQAWQFPQKMLSPRGLSQYQGNLKPSVEMLFYAYRDQKREALMKNREQERLAFDEQVLKLSRQTQPELRKAFLALIAHLPLCKDTFPLVRKCLKLAEFRSDHEWLALLYHRLESNPALSGNFGYAGPDGRHPLTPATRNYFRRRSVRLLKTVAQHQPQAYVPLAVAFLKQIQDGVACFEAKTETLSRYYETDEGYQRRTRKREFPAFSSHLALGYILWQGSRLYQLDKKSLKWLKSESFKTDLERPEAHATLWDQAPEWVLELLLSAQAEMVNDFALARLRSQPEFCQGLGLRAYLALLQRPYLNTALFAAEGLIDKIAEPDVLKAFLDSPFEAVRALALEQLSPAYLLGQPKLLVHLLCSPYPELQARLRSFDTLFAVLDSSFADELVDYLLSQANTYADSGRDLSLLQASVTGFLRDSLRARVSLSTLERLLASPLLFFQTLAVTLLEASAYTYADLAHFPALMQASAYPAVQAGAIRLLAKLPMGVQMGQLPALVSALWHTDRAYRQAAAQILKGLATQAADTDYPAEIWQALYPGFFKSCPEELRFELLELLEAFSALFPLLAPGQVWALLTARAKLAQQVGGRVISAQNGRDFGLEQLIRLSKHACLSARVWALDALQKDPRSLENVELLLEILDNPWDDARQTALNYFRGLPANLWTPERVIAVCDQVYGDVQAFGQDLVSACFQAGQGLVYLLALSQHPSRSIQLFVSGFLESVLAPQPEQILALEPFFRGVLLQVNQGRVLKDRVLRFLSQAALEHKNSPEVAEMVFQLFTQQAMTSVQNDRAQVILALHQLQREFPDRAQPLQLIAPRKVAK
jgi:hypothetical protein